MVCQGAGVHCCLATRSSRHQHGAEGSESRTGHQPAGGNAVTLPSFLSDVSHADCGWEVVTTWFGLNVLGSPLVAAGD